MNYVCIKVSLLFHLNKLLSKLKTSSWKFMLMIIRFLSYANWLKFTEWNIVFSFLFFSLVQKQLEILNNQWGRFIQKQTFTFRLFVMFRRLSSSYLSFYLIRDTVRESVAYGFVCAFFTIMHDNFTRSWNERLISLLAKLTTPKRQFYYSCQLLCVASVS